MAQTQCIVQLARVAVKNFPLKPRKQVDLSFSSTFDQTTRVGVLKEKNCLLFFLEEVPPLPSTG